MKTREKLQKIREINRKGRVRIVVSLLDWFSDFNGRAKLVGQIAEAKAKEEDPSIELYSETEDKKVFIILSEIQV